MANLLHSGDLNTLKLGQTLLTRFRKIEGGFVQMELAEVKEGSRGLSAAFVFNQSDSRFSRNSARRAWQPATPADVESTLGISVADDQAWEMDDMGNEILTVNVLNPVASFKNLKFSSVKDNMLIELVIFLFILSDAIMLYNVIGINLLISKMWEKVVNTV